MKITLLSDDAIRLELQSGQLTIEAADEHMQYSPFHMLASAIASCSYAVLASWAENAGIDSADLAIEVRWGFVEQPHRIGSVTIDIDWPSLPAERVVAAERAVELCAIHSTLTHPPQIVITVRA